MPASAPETRVVVIGSANVDLCMRLPRLPQRGETVVGGTFLTAFGGKGANQAVAAARAGAQTTWVGCLGRDAHHLDFLAGLAADGIATDLARVVDTVASGTAFILVDAQGDNYLAVDAGANAHVAADDVARAAPRLRGAALLLLQMEIPPEANRAAFAAAAAAGVPVLLNYAPAGTRDPEMAGRADILVVNETEAAVLTGELPRDPAGGAAAARALRGLGARTAVVTLGAQGVAVDTDGARFHVPAFRVTAVDATAAGDTFCGALAVALGERLPWPEAVRFGQAAAALAVTRAGAQPSIPRRAEIDAFLRDAGR